jgi:AcrR family transcriptional regulator
MRAYRPIADRRRQLVDASLAIAERDGVGAVTVRRVAAEAGVSLGLVSYCFASKEELTIAMATRIVQELVDAGELASEQSGLAFGPGPAGLSINPAGQSINTVLRAALSGLWAEVERTPGRQLLTYEITTRALREPGLIDVAAEQYSTTVALAAGVLAAAAKTAGVRWTRDLDHLAGLVVMAVDGATLRWLVDQDSEAALARLGDIADLLATMAVQT